MKICSKDLKRDLFVRYYLQYLNINEAYKRAGFSPNDANANRYFHREDVQLLLETYVAKTLQKLDIDINKTLKHLAAIAYGNALDIMEFENGKWKFKELHELPPWVAVSIRKFDKKDKRITYSFEPKMPALKLLLRYLELRKLPNNSRKI